MAQRGERVVNLKEICVGVECRGWLESDLMW